MNKSTWRVIKDAQLIYSSLQKCIITLVHKNTIDSFIQLEHCILSIIILIYNNQGIGT